MLNITYNIKLMPINSNKNYYNYYKQYINQIKNPRDGVKFGLYCVKYYYDNKKLINNEQQKCIKLVESWLKNPYSVTYDELQRYGDKNWYICFHLIRIITSQFNFMSYIINCADVCCGVENINMNLPNQYLQILLRTTKQFNTENYYSQTIKQIVKQDIDKLELVDYNMLLDISNEHYNIDLSEFNYENIFSRRNLIELIRREYE